MKKKCLKYYAKAMETFLSGKLVIIEGADNNSVLEEYKMTTPTLETTGLCLRTFKRDHAPAVFECWESDTGVRDMLPKL